MAQHIIKKQIYDLKMRDRDKAFNVQTAVSNLNQNKITAILDEVCSVVVDENNFLQIDKLELDLGNISLENLETEIEEKIRIKFLEQLNSKYNSASKISEGNLKKDLPIEERLFSVTDEFMQRTYRTFSDEKPILISGTKHKFELLKIYLITGNIPWHVSPAEFNPGEILKQLISEQPSELKKMLSEISIHGKVVERIFAQFSQSSVEDLLNLLKTDFKKETFDFIKSFYELLVGKFDLNISIKTFNEILIKNILQISAPYNFAQVSAQELFTANLLKEEEVTLKTVAELLSKIESIASTNFEKIELLIKQLNVFKQKYFSAASLPAAIGHSIIYSRFLTNFDELIIKNILGSISLPQKEKLISELKGYSDKSKEQIVQTKFDDETKISLTKSFEELIDEEEIKKLKTKIDEVKSKIEQTEDGVSEIDELYINNAGLVIVATFLPRLFQVLDYLEDGKFKDDLHAKRAVHIVQYLVNGTENDHEIYLPLNKILCGLQTYDIINKFETSRQAVTPRRTSKTAGLYWSVKATHDLSRGLLEKKNILLNHFNGLQTRIFEITQFEKEECESLIKAVINNWSAVKNTSVEGFRNSFLQRQGRLTKKENTWNLLVERKAYDMLLAQLPWSISIIKLKWMQTTIFVEW